LKKVQKQSNIWHIWTTFQRLAFGDKFCNGKDIDGFVKADVFDKHRFTRFEPPSWILNFQIQRFFTDTDRTNKPTFEFGHVAAKIR
jgi:hypothetical protein